MAKRSPYLITRPIIRRRKNNSSKIGANITANTKVGHMPESPTTLCRGLAFSFPRRAPIREFIPTPTRLRAYMMPKHIITQVKNHFAPIALRATGSASSFFKMSQHSGAETIYIGNDVSAQVYHCDWVNSGAAKLISS